MENISLLEELDSLSKIHPFQRDRIDELMHIVAKRICLALRIERVNAWLFEGENKEKLVCIGAYDTRTDEFSKGEVLNTRQFPRYFKALEENTIILAPNIHTHPFTAEFSDNYAKEHDVISLMDVPIRIEGKVEGVLCHEKTGKKEKVFTEEQQTFALACTQILASNLEARKRRKYQHELEKNLREKEILLKEINHRVKNNLALLLSVCNIYKKKAKTKQTAEIINNIQSEIRSVAMVHDYMTLNDDSFYRINVRTYINKILEEFCKEIKDMGLTVTCETDIPNVFLNSRQTMYVGMILAEIFQNSIKYYFKKSERKEKKFVVEGKINDNQLVLKMGDNGPGFDFKEILSKQKGTGLHIISDLAESVGKLLEYPQKQNAFYVIKIS
jgi:two-component sensor histidine kinase